MTGKNGGLQLSIILFGTEAGGTLAPMVDRLSSANAAWELSIVCPGTITTKGETPCYADIGTAMDRAQGKYVAFLSDQAAGSTHDLQSSVGFLESQPALAAILPRFGTMESGRSYPGEQLLLAAQPFGKVFAPPLSGTLFRRETVQASGPWAQRLENVQGVAQLIAVACLNGPVFISGEHAAGDAEDPAQTASESWQKRAAWQEYLEWLQGLLERSGNQSVALQQAIERALARPTTRDDNRSRNWLFRVTSPNAARLTASPEREEAVCVSIEKCTTADVWDIQLNLPRLCFEKDAEYVVRFDARAETPRRIFIGAAMAHDPWLGLGLYQPVELTCEWQSFTVEFKATAGDDDTRIHFDLGGSNVSVDLSDVSICFRDGRPAQSGIQWGGLRRVTPVSRSWGFGRGLPVDRYYIERFLDAHRSDIRGRVLEIEDNTYTCRFGGNQVRQSDVLHVMPGNPLATMTGDLTDAPQIPSDLFDCIIFTQTLQLIFDAPAAVRTLARILKPGGVLLATFPGISQTKDVNWGGEWYWTFTPDSARRLFQAQFEGEVAVQTFGNVLAGVALLHGLSSSELEHSELDAYDPGYDVTIGVRTVKPASGAFSARTSRSAHFGSEGSALILMYHRVDRVCNDPFSLSVDPGRFGEHLEVIRSEANAISLQELVQHLESGTVPERSLAITFDDGYLDNATNAQPLLETHAIPATLFVTTGATDAEREFWWDELERMVLGTECLPERFALNLNGAAHEWNLGEEARCSRAELLDNRHWKASEAAPSLRQVFYLELWRLLQPLPGAERLSVMEELAAWSGNTTQRASYRPLRSCELRSMATSSRMELGAHTVTHPPLAVMSEPEQAAEIGQSKQLLENLTGRRIAGFSYPYGSMSGGTARLVADSGFQFACTTRNGLVSAGTDRYCLPRVQVRDWHGEQFSSCLNRWFNSNFEERCFG